MKFELAQPVVDEVVARLAGLGGRVDLGLLAAAHPRSQNDGPTGSRKGRLGPQEPLVVNIDRQDRQRTGGRPEQHVTPVSGVERRLVARAQEVVPLRLVEAHRAAGVGADLGVGDDPR